MTDIELVIKIDEETLQDLYDSRYVSPHIKDVFRSATPLPKGHGKIVDANRVLENGDNWEVETALMQTEAIIEADKAESEEV